MWMVGGALVMTSLAPSDSGIYECIVNNTEGTITLSSRLVVTSLSVQVVSSVGEVTPGSPLELRCYVSGGAVTDFTWFKDALQVSNDGHFVMSRRSRPSGGAGVVDGVLRTEVAEARDAGVYQCRASSPYDVAQHHAFVKLGGEFSIDLR
ncbi:Immunoglobulin I-set [Trinorchestia longiramus]|nr:Immunoglobulin I-set [Trinorchestia longiramus]